MTKKPIEQSLSKSIREDRDQKVSRGLYADWLDDHGAQDRATLIRVHLELEAGPSPKRKKELLRQHERLCPKCHEEWVASLKQLGVEDVHLESGLPYAIFVPVNRFLENTEKLLAAAPFEALCPTITYESRLREIGQLAASPYLAQLPELNIGRRWIGNDGVKLLAASANLQNLKRLKLDYNNVGDRGAVALAHCEFGQLACLDLGMNPIGTRGLRGSG